MVLQLQNGGWGGDVTDWVYHSLQICYIAFLQRTDHSLDGNFGNAMNNKTEPTKHK